MGPRSSRHGPNVWSLQPHLSVTPVVPAFERQGDWLAHRDAIFEDFAPGAYIHEIIAERIAIKVGRMPRTSTDSDTLSISS